MAADQAGAESSRSFIVVDLQVDVDVHAHLERGDIPDDGDRAEDVDDALVDAHLVAIPGVGALAARGLPGGDAQDLRRDPDWAASLVSGSVLLGSADDLSASVLERLDLSALQSESKEGVRIKLP